MRNNGVPKLCIDGLSIEMDFRINFGAQPEDKPRKKSDAELAAEAFEKMQDQINQMESGVNVHETRN
jgi:hypothetical protein